MVFKGLEEAQRWPLPLGARLVVKTLTLSCRHCQHCFDPHELWGRHSHGRTLFVGRSPCPGCGINARFLIQRSPQTGKVSVIPVSAWLYFIALRLLPRAEAPAAMVYTEEVVRRSMESVGTYLDEDIPAWITLQGGLWAFVGVRQDASFPGVDEVMIEPGLIYRRIGVAD